MATSFDSAIATEVTYLDELYASVRWTGWCVVAEWKGYATSPQFRAVQETVWRTIIETSSNRLLVDTRAARLVVVEDERWMVVDLLPRLGLAGIQFTAIVIPENQLARAITVDVAAKAPSGGMSESRMFEDLDEAKSWLRRRDAEER